MVSGVLSTKDGFCFEGDHLQIHWYNEVKRDRKVRCCAMKDRCQRRFRIPIPAVLPVLGGLLIVALVALPAAARQEEAFSLNDVAARMSSQTLDNVARMVVIPLQNRFPDIAAAQDLLGEPSDRKVKEHQSIHDPDYTFSEVTLEYYKSRITFFVFPDREVFSAFEGDPAEAGISALELEQAADEVEKLLGQSFRRSKDMLYSDGEWWIVRLPLDKFNRLQSVELYILFD